MHWRGCHFSRNRYNRRIIQKGRGILAETLQKSYSAVDISALKKSIKSFKKNSQKKLKKSIDIKEEK